jgi:hypothetical protein
VIEEQILGYFDRSSKQELLELNGQTTVPFFERRRQEQIERLSSAIGQGGAEIDPYKVADAAEAGRIDTLFADPESRLARVAIESCSVESQQAAATSAPPHDLMNISICETLMHKGNVIAMNSENMPDGASLAAIMRY